MGVVGLEGVGATVCAGCKIGDKEAGVMGNAAPVESLGFSEKGSV